MGATPQLAKKVTTSFNTYKHKVLDSALVSCAEGAGYQIGDVLGSFTEECYITGWVWWFGCDEKSIMELSAHLRSVPDEDLTDVDQFTVHKHGHQHIPLGQDTQIPAPYNDHRRVDLDPNLWIHYEKGDTMQMTYAIANTATLGLGAFNGQVSVTLLMLTKG